jgi:hypothetical protein
MLPAGELHSTESPVAFSDASPHTRNPLSVVEQPKPKIAMGTDNAAVFGETAINRMLYDLKIAAESEDPTKRMSAVEVYRSDTPGRVQIKERKYEFTINNKPYRVFLHHRSDFGPNRTIDEKSFGVEQMETQPSSWSSNQYHVISNSANEYKKSRTVRSIRDPHVRETTTKNHTLHIKATVKNEAERAETFHPLYSEADNSMLIPFSDLGMQFESAINQKIAQDAAERPTLQPLNA